MAYALSHIHSLIRGSVGGVTYLANQFHQIVMRARTAPVQPNTVYQVGIRTAFNAAEDAWEGLSEASRDDWRFYALTCIYPGPAGDYTVPGRQLFIGTLGLVKYANAIFPDIFLASLLAPVISGWFNPGEIGVGLYAGETQGIAVSVQNPTGRSCIALVDTSIAFNLPRTRYKGPWISSIKEIKFCPSQTSQIVTIDRPVGSLGKAIFTRTRIVTAQASPQPGEPHSLAFPVHLRHICQEPPVNGNDKPAKKPAKTKDKTG